MSSLIKIKNELEEKNIREFLTTGKLPNLRNNLCIKRFIKKASLFTLAANKLYFRCENKTLEVIISLDEKIKIIWEIHAKEHSNSEIVFEQIQEIYFGIPRNLVRSTINNCNSCLKIIQEETKILKPIFEGFPKQRYICDLTDLKYFQNEKFRYLLIWVDSFSKFCFAKPLKTKEKEEVRNAIQKSFYLYGIPQKFHTDNGKEFNNTALKKLLEQFKVENINGAPYKPTSQGQVERLNKTIKDKLNAVCFLKNTNAWDTQIDEVVFKYNSKKHRATGKKPFDLFFLDKKNVEELGIKLIDNRMENYRSKLKGYKKVHKKVVRKVNFKKFFKENFSD